MNDKPTADITELLSRWNSGDELAREIIVKAIYDELTRIAAGHLANERHPVELQPHSLVHEAYLRMVNLKRIDWRDRAHFLAMAARVMREILIDQARRRNAAKRDGGIRVTLSDISGHSNDPHTDIQMLHTALEELTRIDPDRAHLVELRFFGGLTIDETAEILGRSPATVKRDWQVARGWLYRALNAPPTD